MEEVPSHVIVAIFAAVIGAAIITFGFIFQTQNSKAANTVIKSATDRQNSISDQKYANYDEVEYTGSGILRTIKLFQNENISIQVETSTDGIYDTFIYELDGDNNLETRKTSIRADYENAKFSTKRNADSTIQYIPQDRTYTAHLIYSNSGAITGIRFERK